MTLEELDHALDDVVRDVIRRNAPAALYHYTTVDAACGILHDQRFRATSHRSMSDPAELTSAGDVIRSVAADLKRRSHGVEEDILATFLVKYPAWKAGTVFESFLACFCAACDKESQWRLYGAQGEGACLGIRLLSGEEYPPETPPIRGRELFMVDYSESSWRALVQKAFMRALQLYREFERDCPGTTPKLARVHLGVALQRIAALVETKAKRAEFAEEEEWRLVAITETGGEVPSINGRRYVPLELRAGGKLIALDEVMLGPNAPPEAEDEIGEVLTTRGYAGDSMPRITRSKLAQFS